MTASKNALLAAAAFLTLIGCTPHGGGVIVHSPGTATPRDLPPAPAYGRRAQQRYHYQYFPDAQVYFDLDRKLYFYIAGNRWRVSVTLPSYFRLRLGGHPVALQMGTERPYEKFHQHRKKYPPGQAKKKNKTKHKKDKSKGHGNRKFEEHD